jgi:hypothetical protein
MTLTFQTKEQLDRFGPYGSAIGNLMGFLLLIYYFNNDGYIIQHISFSEISILIGLILSYILNTCTHRRLFFFSKAAQAGTLGSIIGWIVGPIVSFFSLPIFGFGYLVFIPWVICIIMFPFFFARQVCQSERNKANRWFYTIPQYPITYPMSIINQGYLNSQQTQMHCRFCDTSLAYTPICPKCGRRNP